MDTNKATKPATKGDIEEIKTDIGEVKADIDGIKADMTGVKADIKEVKTEIEDLAATTNKAFTKVEEKFDLVLSTLDNLSGQIEDVKQSRVSVLDHMRLEDRVEVVEEKLVIKS